MRKFGLIGGLGPESTIPYYHDIVYGVRKKLGDEVFPELTIESVDVFKALGYCKEKEYDKLTDYLLEALQHLKASGADFAAIGANTPHVVFPELMKRSPLLLLSIVDATYEEAAKRNMKKVGLLGTIFTMEEDFLKQKFIENGICVVVPDKGTREYMNDKITNELELGIVNEEVKEKFFKIVDNMIEKDGVEGIILGCTELPLVFHDRNISVPYLDTLKIHINAIVDYILNEK